MASSVTLHACPALTLEGQRLQSSVPPSQLHLVGQQCSERFVTEVACNNRSYIFSRHDLGDHSWYDTLVRSSSHPAPRRYPNASVGLHHKLLMSHNMAVICNSRDGALHAYGGMSHKPKSPDWHGGDVGIMRSVASAGPPPLAWSTPLPVVSGKRATGCIDKINSPCEYDGKVAAVAFRGEVLLFTRSNLSPQGGARHVQVTRSADGVRGWSRFKQLEFEGLQGLVGRPETNMYFFTVRVLRDRGEGDEDGLLLGSFPGSLGGKAGVFCSVSRDGVHWSAPLRLLASRADGHWRTRDYPVDGSLAPPAQLGGEAAVRLVLQLGVDLREYKRAAMNEDCAQSVGRSRFCAYTLDAARLGALGAALGPPASGAAGAAAGR